MSVQAQDDADLAELFGDIGDEDITPTQKAPATPSSVVSRWYAPGASFTQTTLTASFFSFTTPVAKKSDGTNVATYSIQYATAPLASVDAVDVSKKVVQFASVSNKTTLSFEVTWLNADTQYYFAVVPMDGNQAGNPLQDFNIKTTASQWSAWTHGAADMNLANVSYTYEGNNYTVSWTPVDGAEKVQIYLKPADAWDYVKQPDVAMNAGIYKFTANKEGDYLVKMIPVDAANNPVGSELVQTIKVSNIVSPASPVEAEKQVIKSVPKVWPGLNLMIGLFLFGILMYMLFKSRTVNK